jgi:UV DNA damage endonuclease
MDNFAGVDSRSYWYPLNIHMSRSAGDPEVIAKEFISNYQKLPERVRARLVLENEDKGVWTPDMLFELIHLETGIPITYDNLHHRCNPGLWGIEEAFRVCCSTWKAHGVNPLFHYSEGGANNNPRAHTDFATSSPVLWRSEYDSSYTRDIHVDWDIEIKQKDYAIDHMVQIEEKSLHAI